MVRARIAVALAVVVGVVAMAENATPGDWLIVGVIVALPPIGLLLRGYLRALCRRARQRHRDREYVRSGLAAVDAMPGCEFEDYVAARLRTAGWNVLPTPATGDYGVDLIAQKDDERVAIQCKRRARSIGVSAVQQVVAGALHHECASTMVVSNQEFTKAAKHLADTHGCQLVGRAGLSGWKP